MGAGKGILQPRYHARTDRFHTHHRVALLPAMPRWCVLGRKVYLSMMVAGRQYGGMGHVARLRPAPNKMQRIQFANFGISRGSGYAGSQAAWPMARVVPWGGREENRPRLMAERTNFHTTKHGRYGDCTALPGKCKRGLRSLSAVFSPRFARASAGA
jgi:hypothetical protein